jgi:hypothetical protein
MCFERIAPIADNGHVISEIMLVLTILDYNGLV